MKKTTKKERIDTTLLKSLCSVHAPSGEEYRMKEYLLNFVINFLAMHGHVGGGADADLDRVAAVHPHDLHRDAAIDDDAFAEFAGEDEHGIRRWRATVVRPAGRRR